MATVTKYTYSITEDTKNGRVNTTTLEDEIAVKPTIIIAISYIETNNDVLDIYMKDALTNDEETALTAVVAAHEGNTVENISIVHLDTPETSDGKAIFLPCLFPGNVFLYPTGAGDHVTNQTRGDGQAFTLECTATQDYEVEWQFIDWVYLAGGGIKWKNGEAGDWVSLLIYAPATPVTPNVGNTGNCDLVDPGVGQAILIVPANGDGAYDVDLDDAIPVPSYIETEEGIQTPNGYYEWSNPDIGLGVVSIGTAQHSSYNLFAAAINLARFANRLQMVDSGIQDLTVPAVKPKKILPQWKYKVTAHHIAGSSNFKVEWWLVTARTTTV